MNTSRFQVRSKNFPVYSAFILLLLLACAERIYGIDRQSLWSDEIFAVNLSYHKQFLKIWDALINDSHPPGYSLFMYFTLPVTGYTDFGIRLHALIFGIAWIPLVFWIASRWFTPRTAIIATALITSSHQAIYFSQEARAYTMLVFFALINTACYLEILFAKPNRSSVMAGYIISTTLLVYWHYAGFVFFMTEVLLYLLLWVMQLRRGTKQELQLCFGLPLALYSPWLGFMYNHVADQDKNWAVSGVPTSDYIYYTFQRLWGPDNRLLLLFICSLAVVIFLLVIDSIRRHNKPQQLIIFTVLFLLVIPVLAFYLESILWTPIFEKRYFLITLPLIIFLTAYLIDRLITSSLPANFLTPTILLLSCIFTCWAIANNIERGLYSENNKDPIREAVGIVKNDLGSRAASNEYTILMTHDWFEHYLRTLKVIYDTRWKFRWYYAPQQINNINDYLKARPHIKYFYYLLLKQPSSDSAAYALKQQYKLLSKAQLSVPTGTIEVLKFSTTELPDDTQLANAGSNRINDAVKALAQELVPKGKEHYSILMTHDWLQPYVTRNGITVDTQWPGRMFYLDVQYSGIYYYLQAHPAIDTIYYLALQDPKTDNAVSILMAQYELLAEKNYLITAGTLKIYSFNVHKRPSITTALANQTKMSPGNQAPAYVSRQTLGIPANSYTTLMNDLYFEPYLRLNHVAYDPLWEGRLLTADFQVARVTDYLANKPSLTNLYFIALRNAGSERSALLLQALYTLSSQQEFDTPYGKIDVYKFDTKKRPVLTESMKNKLLTLPLYMLAHNIANDSHATPSRSTTLFSHDWFQLYLELNKVPIDTQWNGRIYSQEGQASVVSPYLAAHPDLNYLYYLALDTAFLSAAQQSLEHTAQPLCQEIVDNPPLGKLVVVKYSLRNNKAANTGVLPKCFN